MLISSVANFQRKIEEEAAELTTGVVAGCCERLFGFSLGEILWLDSTGTDKYIHFVLTYSGREQFSASGGLLSSSKEIKVGKGFSGNEQFFDERFHDKGMSHPTYFYCPLVDTAVGAGRHGHNCGQRGLCRGRGASLPIPFSSNMLLLLYLTRTRQCTRELRS